MPKLVSRNKDLRKKALDKSNLHLITKTPFNDYTKAQDMSTWRKILTKFTDKGVSNCTLCASNSYGDDYTFGSAYNLIKSGKFKEIPASEIKEGDLMIQSLPGVPDGYDNKYHTAIYAGIADSDYINTLGDFVNKGDTLYNYSRGKKDFGQFVQRTQVPLRKNHGKTNFRFFTPLDKDEYLKLSERWNNYINQRNENRNRE